MKPKTIPLKELAKILRRWKTKIEDLHAGKNWAVNDRACKENRANKAEGVHECVVDLEYLRKHGKAD